jgi:hypothetical protein
MTTARKSLVALTAAVCGLSAHEGSALSLRSGQVPAPQSQEAKAVANIGSVMVGQDMLVYDLWSTDGAGAAVFAASYSSGKKTADNLWLVPDGYDISQTTQCSSSVVSDQVSGETSLMATQTTEIKFSVSAEYGPVSGSLENSLLFKTSSKMMSENDSFMQVTSLKCRLYQVVLNTFVMPPMTGNFADGLASMRGALNPASQSTTATPGPAPTAPSATAACAPPPWCKSSRCQAVLRSGCLPQAHGGAQSTLTPAAAAQAFLLEFGTHFMTRGSLGSAFMSTTSTTREQQSKLESADTSVGVCASAAMWGQSVGTSVLSANEQENAAFFEKLSTNVAAKTIGVTLPAGNTKAEVVANWQMDTLSSNGLALVGGLLYSRLDQLLAMPSALRGVNAALDNGKQPFTDDELDTVRNLLTQSINGYCAAMMMDCDGPAADKPLPGPAAVTPSAYGPVYGGNGGAPFNGISGEHIATLFGQKAMTYDIRPVKVDAIFKIYADRQILCAIQTTYQNSAGIQISSDWNGAYGECIGMKSDVCSLALPYDYPVTTFWVNSGAWIDGFSFQTRDLTRVYSCGTAGGATSKKEVLLGSMYWFGFTGHAGNQVDSIQMMTADPVTPH